MVPATTETYTYCPTLSLHAALPSAMTQHVGGACGQYPVRANAVFGRGEDDRRIGPAMPGDCDPGGVHHRVERVGRRPARFDQSVLSHRLAHFGPLRSGTGDDGDEGVAAVGPDHRHGLPPADRNSVGEGKGWSDRL